MRVDQLDWHLTEFVWTTPAFSMQAAVSLGVPLFVVAMASQNLPGLAILQAAGYRPPASRLVAATGFLGLLAAPFGAHSVTLGAISAAICTGPEAHAEPSKRYIAAATYGISYFALSIVAGAVAVFFQALPAALLARIEPVDAARRDALLQAVCGGDTLIGLAWQETEGQLEAGEAATAFGVSVTEREGAYVLNGCPLYTSRCV